jgi:uncharacterized protein YwgA
MGKIGKLKLCFERIGGFQLDTFVDRKLLQKKVYFLQEFGINLGYYFGFYLFGPYCSELTNDAFFLVALVDQAPMTLEIAELSSEEEEVIERAREFFDGFKGEKADIASKLELLSSLHFLWSISHFQNKSKEEVFRKLKAKKQIFTDDDLENAWKYLVAYGLINS